MLRSVVPTLTEAAFFLIFAVCSVKDRPFTLTFLTSIFFEAADVAPDDTLVPDAVVPDDVVPDDVVPDDVVPDETVGAALHTTADIRILNAAIIHNHLFKCFFIIIESPLRPAQYILS